MLGMDSLEIEGKSEIDGIVIVAFHGAVSLTEKKDEVKEKYNFSNIIFDEDVYEENKDKCDSDYDRFKSLFKQYAGTWGVKELLTPRKV